MGLGVLVKVAGSGLVYPLLGRPHDPLLGEIEDKGAEEAGYDNWFVHLSLADRNKL